MASNTSICGICSLRQITKTSDHWCPECEEALCNECKAHHKLLKATRRHEPIPISSYKSLPSYINDIKQSCVYHNEQYQIYCNEHELPLCLQCINDHSKCDVVSLEKVISNIKTSGQFLDLESRLNDLLQNIERIKKNREANVTDIEKKREQHVKEIKQIRVEMNNHLDYIEKQILDELNKKECQCKDSIQKVLVPVKERGSIITQCQLNFKSLKEYASDFQTYIGMRDLEVKVDENEQYLQSLIDTKCFGHLDFVYKVDTNVQSILNNLKSFGSIEIKNHISDIELTRAKDKQAQIQVAATRKTVNDVKLIQQKKITPNGMAVRGCCMSREGDFLFTDHVVRSLYVIKSDGTLEYKMSVGPSDGFDITFVDDNNVAVTSGDSTNKTGIDIINIENRRNLKFVELPGRPYGISRDHDSLFVCVEKCGIYIVSTVDYTTSHVISCNLPWYTYVFIFADKIYYTDEKDQSVVCCNRHNGSRVWTFKDTSVLTKPRGITVDNDGNVYVVGETSSNVVILSNDGKRHRQILTGEDGLDKPSAIFFDRHKKKLLVTNLEHSAFLYNVAYT